ncbi:hypothetical protein VNO77_03652 [Canavalia gladiata]|uniref:Uncharacterized protein n=1 Tax=Canavalia gladiata TaxID=3824 RepID=A0AAN9N087_CANGL
MALHGFTWLPEPGRLLFPGFVRHAHIPYFNNKFVTIPNRARQNKIVRFYPWRIAMIRSSRPNHKAKQSRVPHFHYSRSALVRVEARNSGSMAKSIPRIDSHVLGDRYPAARPILRLMSSRLLHGCAARIITLAERAPKVTFAKMHRNSHRVTFIFLRRVDDPRSSRHKQFLARRGRSRAEIGKGCHAGTFSAPPD